MTPGTELQNVNERIGDFRVVWFVAFREFQGKRCSFLAGNQGQVNTV